ncbi:putative vomeronasal receptor-like protein 4 [Manis javanica]|nr:putative vomeronasal receptor-like protein 4 [Manis javanica]
MIWSNIIQRIIFLSFIGPGSVRNFLIFGRHIYTFVMDTEKKTHMHYPHSFDLLQIQSLFVPKGSKIQWQFFLRNFLGNVGCKTVLYLGRVAHGLSVCTTCLLSGAQVITISPRTMSWGKLKPWTAWHVLLHLLLFWIFDFMIISNLLYCITTINSMNISAIRPYVGYCYLLPYRQMLRWFFTLMALRDIIFQSLMHWSSWYMAFHLYKHHECVLYFQNSRFQKENPGHKSNLYKVLSFL